MHSAISAHTPSWREHADDLSQSELEHVMKLKSVVFDSRRLDYPCVGGGVVWAVPSGQVGTIRVAASLGWTFYCRHNGS
jgi:hypothetical protein